MVYLYGDMTIKVERVCQRRCLALGCATGSFHRQSWWTFQLQRLWVPRGSGGDEGVGAHHTGDELN